MNCDIFGISAYSTQYKYLKEFSLQLKNVFPINMTGFSDEEFLKKQDEVMREVNARYFSRHPYEGFIYYLIKIKYIIKLPFLKPRYFIQRLKEKLKLNFL